MDILESLTTLLESPVFPGALRVVAFDLIEGLDDCYRLRLDIEVTDPAADVTSMLGTDCVLTLLRTPLARRFAGLVLEVHEGQVTEAAGPVLHARIVVAPALSLLRFRRNTRIFQEKTVPEILQAVLEESLAPYGREVTLELDHSFVPREHCLQYQESDLAFVQRLMEEEGIYYAFDHAGDKEVLVLRDKSSTAEKIVTFPEGGALELHPLEAVVRDREPILRFVRRHRPTATSVVVRDRDWTRADLVVEAEERGTDVHGLDREVYEHGIDRKLQIAKYSGTTYGSDDGARQAKLRLEGYAQGALTIRGASSVCGMIPGGAFELIGHPTPGFDGEYLITRVVHESRPAPGGGGGGDRYHNRFECIPLSVPYRSPRRTPRPVIEGIQTAVVTGPSGEEIHVDEHGRIKVRFHWDRESPADETSSCWIRVKQEWAGAGWGFWWVPRIGMEVVVHFIDGDPDRPLVTGAVYDADNPLPYPQPDEKTKSTIKSNSSLGGGGFNELRFEDKAGSEEIYTHAQKDYNEVVENDHNTVVHGHQTNEVVGNQTQIIHGSQTERVDGTQDMSVGGNRTVHVEGNFEETVDGTETRSVVGDVDEFFAATEERAIGASVTEDIGGDETRMIGASQTEEIGGSKSQAVAGSATVTITGALDETVTGGITTTTPASFTATAVGGWTVTAAAGLTITAAAGATLIMPGGMTRCDNLWQLLAGSISSKTPFQAEAYITKSEVYGGAYAGGVMRVAFGEGKELCATAAIARGMKFGKVDAELQEKAGFNAFRFALKL